MAKSKRATVKKKVPVKKAVAKKAAKKSTAKVAKTHVKAVTTKSKKSLPEKKSAKKTKGKQNRRKPETLMCFLTTACVDHYSLPDNGYELTTLRNYRDNYLAANKGGKKLIEDYYRLSPKIVTLVNRDKQKDLIYEYIYKQVQASCLAIESRKFILARKIYTKMVTTLVEKYQVS